MYTIEELAELYDQPLDSFAGYGIIYADYESGGYEGDAFVLAAKDGKMYWNFGSHCSCYGLEGQWDPEEVTLEEIKFRIERGSGWGAFGSAIPFLKEYFKI
jgi:hypothetical protein